MGPAPLPFMTYQVLARKWRPQTFDEVVGQPTLTRTLRNALTSGRIGHAFLFSGARGVGKTTTARILAKALNCSRGEGPTPDPCGKCSSCQEIAAGGSLDVQEIDGATNNGVEQVRELRESARYNPARDRFKIWIIDEVHMLSTGAFNALLKTLEEPPPRVKFIFATTEYHRLPDTILSRCQQYDFRLIPTRELQVHLRKVAEGEGVRVSDEALARIAHAAEGSVRDALSLFDQVLSFSGSEVKDEDLGALLGLIDRELLFRASRAVAAGDNLGLLDLVESLSTYGADYRNFARELLLHFRELLLLKLAAPGSPLLAATVPGEGEKFRPLADAFSEEDLLRILDLLTQAETELRPAQDPRVTLELVLLKMAQMPRLRPFAELVARVERLAAGTAAPAAPRALPPPSAAPRALPPPSAAAVDPPPKALEPVAETPSAGSEADEILAGMLSLCQARPSLATALRGAQARLEGDSLALEVAPDFAALAGTHVDEYRELAAKAAGRALKVRVGAGAAIPAPPASSPAELARQRLRQEAEREPAVQEALDLFDGRVVDVREAKP
ncbi:MAG TPA: DNA polymerase III subunit gamma/tau [Vicinamibacteria bacterium]|nr:DNA polymerase III subunit gamma/tau [Vicinamibacteria bacterium]